jgi:hypothetical protein
MRVLQKAIHGSKLVPKKAKRKHKIKNTTRKHIRRMDLTGLKHFTTNKIRLRGQAEYFDLRPNLLIVPVLSVDAMKNWNGQGYSAVVIAGEFDRISAASVYQGIDFGSARIEYASTSEIEVARQSLEQAVLGLSYSLLHRINQLEAGVKKSLTLTRLKVLRARHGATNRSGIIVPKPSGRIWLRVAKVTFEAHSTAKGHPAPDPLLLAAKSAINWSWRHGQQLLAAGEPPEEDELDILAEEQYLEWRDSCIRPGSFEKVAIGLGQPNGYQG